jgi:outer membrane murein-binding lipoprotein Lpp
MKKTKNAAAATAAIAASVAVLGGFSSSAAAHGHSSSSTALQASLESRLNSMEAEMQALRSELAASKAESQRAAQESAQRLEQTEQRQVQTEQKLAQDEETVKKPKSLLFFRGGFTHMTSNRDGELLLNNQLLNPLPIQPNNGDGWYVGAGFDHRLTDDTWGMTDLMAVDGEVMFQYMNFGTSYNALVGNYVGGALQIENQLTQLTISASPKLKFNLLDGDLRPWIIPFGLSINVISPPSSGVTVLNPGLMLGTGIEYRIWENLWAGMDFRYNFTGGDFNYRARLPGGGAVALKQTNIDGLMVGGTLGFGF